MDDALKIAEALVHDRDELVQKAVGWMLREIGNKDASRHAAFLEAHAATMPRMMLRYSIEKLSPDEQKRYLASRSMATANDLSAQPRSSVPSRQ